MTLLIFLVVLISCGLIIVELLCLCGLTYDTVLGYVRTSCSPCACSRIVFCVSIYSHVLYSSDSSLSSSFIVLVELINALVRYHIGD